MKKLVEKVLENQAKAPAADYAEVADDSGLPF